MLKHAIQEDMKTAMRAREADRLSTIRMLLAQIKQIEVDERIEPDDARITEIISRMIKQRQESVRLYQQGKREDLAAKEEAEIQVLQGYLPKQLDQEEIRALIDAAMTASGAQSKADMGKVMALLRPQMLGRADMSEVSQMLKNIL